MSSPSEIEIEGEDTRLCRVYNARLSYLRGDRRFTRHNPELGIVTKPVRVGRRDLSAPSVMAEEGAESRRCHRVAASRALEGHEQRGGIGQRPFQAKVALKHFHNLTG